MVSGAGAAAHASDEVNVYSARKEVLIRPLLERFTDATGIEVNLISADAGALLQRLKREGRNTPADLVITVDAGNLVRAKEANVLAPVNNQATRDHVPDAYQDPDGHWHGLSLRARVIFRSAERVEAGAIERYEELADERWREEICVRSSDSIYNQSLVASLVAHHGVEATEQWAEGLVANLARNPQGGDRDQIKAVAAGQCDLAIANTYYYGRMIKSDGAAAEAANQVELVWPNQDDRGAHVNVSGAGLTRHGPNRDNAERLLSYLLTEDAQRWYAEVNNEYPVRPDTEAASVLQAWGEFQADGLNLSELGEHNADAVRLMDRAGWR
jgi:iron(III) transport system substrate-binding protein